MTRTGYKFTQGAWWEDLKEIDYQEDLRVDGEIILKWILNKYARKRWTEMFFAKAIINLQAP